MPSIYAKPFLYIHGHLFSVLSPTLKLNQKLYSHFYRMSLCTMFSLSFYNFRTLSCIFKSCLLARQMLLLLHSVENMLFLVGHASQEITLLSNNIVLWK